MLLFNVVLPFALERLQPRQQMRLALLAWLRAVGRALRLQAHLLPAADVANRGAATARGAQPLPPGEAPQHPARGERAAAPEPGAAWPGPALGAATGAEAEPEPVEVPHHNLRMAALSLAAWASIMGVGCFGLSVPVALGRALCSFTKQPLNHDLYACAAGCYGLWAAAAATRVMRRAVAASTSASLPAATLALARRATRGALRGVAVALWLGPLPLCLGHLVDAVVMLPLRGSSDPSSPPLERLSHSQCWAMGLLVLKYCNSTLALLPQEPAAPAQWRAPAAAARPAAGLGALRHGGGAGAVEEGAGAAAAPPLLAPQWLRCIAEARRRVDQLLAAGVVGAPAGWLIAQVEAPALAALLAALLAPPAAARWAARLAGALPEHARTAEMLSHFLLAAALALGAGLGCAYSTAAALHDSIRDDRYLVARQLRNFGASERAEGQQGDDSKED